MVRRLLLLVLPLAAGALLGTATADATPTDGIDLADADRCDFLDPAVCLFPWPNDYFTVADRTTDTGRRLNLARESMPRNSSGIPIDPSEYNRSDGFSPGQKIVTKVPGFDTPAAFERTGAVPITDLARAFDRNQPVVVINARTRRRHLIWSELDANPTNPADVTLLIRPAINFEEGERYIVALRSLRDADGRTIPAQPAFRLYRDRTRTREPAVERRRRHMESIFRTLGRAGIRRDSLYLAWDFTVGSERSLTGRALHVRNDAFAQLGDRNLKDLRVRGRAPQFAVTAVTDFVPCGSDGCQDGEDDRIARRVEGTVRVPCYLDRPGCPPGSRFNFASPGDEAPTQLPGNWIDARFICHIARTTIDGPGVRKARPSLYGHGLLGSPREINQGQLKDLGNDHNFIFCATPWIGMSEEDIGNAIRILQNLSLFPSLVDRLQQGFVDFFYLGRLMIHPDGFSSHPAFRDDGESVIDTRRLFYDGNSQGGIFGGALAALAPDFERAVLGVPGMNYSTLLRRSVDFDTYSLILAPSYPSLIERPLILSLIQTLWDRADANGYAHHMTRDPLPGTPAHNVLLHVALGDHQVAQVAAEVEARTIGARLRTPAIDPGRSFDRVPFFGIRPIPRYPFGGSALVIWDSGPLRPDGMGGLIGTPPAPVTNTPPRVGQDPHEHPRREASARLQKSEFLKIDGRVIDVCDGHPCYAGGWTGP
jgi:hypothetical protein